MVAPASCANFSTCLVSGCKFTCSPSKLSSTSRFSTNILKFLNNLVLVVIAVRDFSSGDLSPSGKIFSSYLL